MGLTSLKNLFVTLYIATIAVVFATGHGLPDTIASNFGDAGRARGFMSRAAYLTMMGLLIGIIPLILVFAFKWLPRRLTNLTNIPNRSYWLAPERRAQFQLRMEHAGLFMGSSVVTFMGAMHWLVFEANEVQPPRLASGPFFLVLGMFVVTTIGFLIWMSLEFRNPPA